LMRAEGKENFTAKISLKKHMGDVKLVLSAHGEKFNSLSFYDEISEDDEEYYRIAILKAYQEKMRYYRKGTENIIVILVHETESKEVRNTLLGLIIGLFLGVLLKEFAGVDLQNWILYNVFDALQAMFMDALMMVVAPMIFFSIISSISSMSDAAYIKRTGGRLVICSLLKLSFYITIGLFVGNFIGSMPELSNIFSGEVGGYSVAATVSLSIRNLIVDIVPGNLVNPFANNNILQMLFLACLFGVMLSRSGNRTSWAKEGVEFMSRFTIDVLGVISKLIPALVAVSMAELMMKTDISILLSYGKIIFLAALGLPLSLLLSSMLAALFGHIRPTVFLGNVARFIVLPFSTSNSSACMPATMKFCTEKLGIEENFAKFSIPMGMQFNMAGTAYYVAIISMIMVHTFGIDMNLDFILSLFVAELFMALTGVGLIAMPSLFGAMGVPAEVVAFFIGIEPLLDMPGTAQSVTENISSSYLISCWENLVKDNNTRS
ncbi:MAG: cation:dicarboxylase symporter family transporter, partial [Selenomonadaceae bacterium]|nr:cation:dicarboxylase symporter family transporter [Selenomonadaceae bacterium]